MSLHPPIRPGNQKNQSRPPFAHVTFLTLVMVGMLFLSAIGKARAQAPQVKERATQTLNLVLTRHGFQHQDIKIPAGWTRLSLHNRTFVADLDLRLERKVGAGRQSLSSRLLDRKRPAWRDEVNFTPGTYVVSVAGRPKWSIELEVVPRGQR